MLSRLMTSAALCLWSGVSFAQTFVGGVISNDTTWQASGNPYFVTSSLVIGGGATLTIEEGVLVYVEQGNSIAVGNISLGSGSIVANGTESSPIVLASVKPIPAPGDWGFLLFADLSFDATFDPKNNEYLDGSKLQHVIIQHAGGGSSGIAALTLEKCNVFLDHVTIQDSAREGLIANLEETTHSMRILSSYFLRCVSPSASARGGGARITGGTTHYIAGCSFEDCSVTGTNANGGGLYMSGGAGSTLIDNTFSNCSALLGSGGGYYSSQSHATTIDGMTLTNCRAINGAAIVVSANNAVINRLHAENNSCSLGSGDAGALSAAGTNHLLTNSSFVGNKAGLTSGGDAGALFIGAASSTIENCSFIGNMAGDSGGAVRISGLNITMRSCTFDDNHVVFAGAHRGGGAAVLDNQHARFEDCTFTNNSSPTEGGTFLIPNGGAFARIIGCHIESGDAGTNGGGICSHANDVKVEASTMIANHANRGGAIYIQDSAIGFDLTGNPRLGSYSTFQDNTATQGPAIYNELPFRVDGSHDIMATGNCWGTFDASSVPSMIHDFFDNSMLGIVNYISPFSCTCIADVNADGMLSAADFSAWIAEFNIDSFLADQNNDGIVTPADFSAWIGNFNAGCG